MDVKLCEEIILKFLKYKYFEHPKDAPDLSEAKSGVVTLFSGEKENKMGRICDVSWHGAYRKAQIEIGEDVDNFFSKKHMGIILYIDDHKYYSSLPPSFFTKSCPHLRTAYDYQRDDNTNCLHEWVTINNVKKAKLEVITKYIEFELLKHE